MDVVFKVSTYLSIQGKTNKEESVSTPKTGNNKMYNNNFNIDDTVLQEKPQLRKIIHGLTDLRNVCLHFLHLAVSLSRSHSNRKIKRKTQAQTRVSSPDCRQNHYESMINKCINCFLTNYNNYLFVKIIIISYYSM